MRGPRHRIDYVEVASAGLGHGGGGMKKGNGMDGREGRTGRSVQRVLFDFRPARASGLLLFPDDHLAVVRA